MVESSFRCLLLLRGLRCDKFTDLSQTHRERNIFLDNEALKISCFDTYILPSILDGDY